VAIVVRNVLTNHKRLAGAVRHRRDPDWSLKRLPVEETATTQIAVAVELGAKLQDSTLTQVADEILGIQKKWEQRPSTWPAAGRLTSPFGNRFHPIMGYTIFHDGIDIANATMTPIHATADGVVKFVGVKGDYGKMIIISHPGAGCETAYAHLYQAVVTQGTTVKRGELIAHMGNTGRSTGPHLHYEVRVAGFHKNPLAYILPTDVVVD
jgi:murein DD-endopeptidase MepM/ murein hydrolase activator NlpD